MAVGRLFLRPFELLLMLCSLVQLKVLQNLHFVLVVVLRGFLLLVFNDLVLFWYLKVLLLADRAGEGLVELLTVWIEYEAIIHEWPVRDSSG